MTQSEDLQGYRNGLAAGELRGQYCAPCERYQWPPRPACMGCRSFEVDWVRLPPTASLHTWTVVARTKLPGFEDKVPYAVGVLEYGDLRIRLVGHLATAPDALRVGDQFDWAVEPSADGSPQPVWRPAVAAEVA
ncbi:Zn-ribbon domain-containing OB-fold protein [Nocardia goodfellowii]